MLQALWNWLRSLFFSKHADIALIGLQNSGKTSLVNVLASGEFNSSMIPTVGFNLRKVTKGNVTFKLWDIGGQPRFRSMWERYCRGVAAIVFLVDAADRDTFSAASAELNALLEKPQLMGIPLLVLGNKSDLEPHASVQDIISALELTKITNREVSCYSISAKSQHNVDLALKWLLKRA
ncbi:hypothetical protein ACM66B_006706 [Microbotryomycetes sp. NB124-2]